MTPNRRRLAASLALAGVAVAVGVFVLLTRSWTNSVAVDTTERTSARLAPPAAANSPGARKTDDATAEIGVDDDATTGSAASASTDELPYGGDDTPTNWIVGTVSEHFGRPVAGARVEVRFGLERSQISSAVTEADGAFSFDINRLCDCPVIVQPPGDSTYASPPGQVIRVAGHRNTYRADFVLEEGAALAFVVINEQADPVAKAKVGAKCGELWRWKATGAEGRCEIPGFNPASIYDLRVEAEGYEDLLLEGLAVVDGDQRVVLRRAASLTLQAVWAADRAPVMQYDLRLAKVGAPGGILAAGHATTATARDDVQFHVESPTGERKIQWLSPGDWRAAVAVKVPDAEAEWIRGGADFQLNAGIAEQRVVIAVDGGSDIVGTVHESSPQGPPVEGVYVGISLSGKEGRTSANVSSQDFRIAPAMTDQRGRFRLANVPPGRHHLYVDSQEFAMVQPLLVDVPDDGSELERDVVVQAAVEVDGIVLDTKGHPAAGALVGFTYPAEPSTEGGRIGWSTEAPVDSEGRFALRLAPPAPHRLTARIFDDRGATLVDRRVVDLTDPANGRGLVIDFSRMVEVSGLVTINGAHAFDRISSVTFSLDPGGGPGVTSPYSGVILAPDSSFALHVHPGRHFPSAHARFESFYGWPPAIEVAALPPRQIIDLFLETGTLEVTLQFPAGHDFEAGTLTLTPQGGGPNGLKRTLVVIQPRRTIPNVFVNDYQLVFSAGTWFAHASNLRPAPGGTTAVILRVDRFE